VPVLRRRGKVWSLDFSFEEKISLSEQNDIENTRILSVDLGINNACTCSVMQSDGAVAGRHFLRLPAEYDRLEHALDKIKRAQRVGARRMPKLWARARGVNDDIAVKTAQFIVDVAMEYSVDVIVMEALELQGRKCGSKRQRLHHWRAQYVQSMVRNKAHRAGIRISRVCAWNTSRLAFDGSGKVLRGRELAEAMKSEQRAMKTPNVSYSICRFTTGKVYNCDLNASYNIGARYFIREILRNQSAKTRSALEAKVPSVSHRSTCTLSDLKDLRAALVA
jgi:IS605 OrfB family transposase